MELENHCEAEFILSFAFHVFMDLQQITHVGTACSSLIILLIIHVWSVAVLWSSYALEPVFSYSSFFHFNYKIVYFKEQTFFLFPLPLIPESARHSGVAAV